MHIIEVERLTKEYRLGTLRDLRQVLLNTGARLTGRPVAEPRRFKALDDVSFNIGQGEVVGIIGHNGAGKSTLLKMLARITTPTRGTVRTKGQIAPLIEVGAGFVPDFTGRENVYLNGAILGMSRREVDKKLDEIVAFAEMEQFIDTPVKRYSSGMQVKLAFSVATSIDAEILIVDEVLAVGDLAFQRKCFERMEDLIKRQGKTVLLVSHNIRQVERLCTRVMLLSKGRVVLDADPKTVCTAFYNISNEKIYENHILGSAGKSVQSSGEIDVLGIALHADDAETNTDEIPIHAAMSVKLHLRVDADLRDIEIVLGVHTTDFLYLFSATSSLAAESLALGRGEHGITCRFSDLMLTPGVYSLRLAIRVKGGGMLWYGENLLPFKVSPGTRSVASIPTLGLFDVPCEWEFSAARTTDAASTGERCGS